MLGYRSSKDQLAFYVLLLVALSVSSSAGVATDVVSAQVDAGVDGSAVSSGGGTATSPFQITSCAELQAIEYDLGAGYVLTQDIDCTGFDAGDGQGFLPIGNNSNLFTGSLDGAGHVITGLVINRPSDDWVGLFGVTQGALVTRIGLQGVFIEGRQRVGGLVGWLREGGIEESFVTGTVTGEQYVGGIAGRAQDGSISNSYAQVSLSCTKWDAKANKTNADCGAIIGGVVQGVTYNSYGAGPLAPQHGATGGGGPETLVASFFDCELTDGCGNTHPEGRPTAMLQDPSFYEAEGWDFENTWGFSSQMVHPCLQWQPTCSGGPGCGPDDPSCDGVDDDCDGAIDEDFPSVPTTCGVGACSATGATSCDGGQVLDSCTPGTSALDDATCDAIDDDCDEATDENFVSVSTTCGVGACAGTGETSCVDGTVEDSCVAGDGAPNDPTCDGGDDDCDGTIDEDYASRSTACGVGACVATGVTSCVDGAEEDSCLPGTPATEDVSCNGIDDNCDGTVDSDFMPSDTTCGVGACVATGTGTCVDGQIEDDCAPGTPASDDTTCDNIDADCDGATDEDFPSQSTTCGVGACAATGASSCVGGQVQDTCVPGSPALNDAVCDGLDEDCDGLVDEEHVLVPTSCGIGACASAGVLSCVGGVIIDTCNAGVPASDDATCDGIDDNCDGQADEDCCIPATCQDYNINCGTVDDGCAATIDCGTCSGEETCGGGGVPNVCGTGLPPDPEDVAPQTNVGTGGFLQSFAFLTEGPNPIQTGVGVDAIDARRAAILRGRVLTRSSEPIPAVKVSVPRNPSLGETASRADGRYDLLVNGGSLVTLEFSALGYLPMQRTMNVPWEGAIQLDDVVMTPASDVATVVQFGAPQAQGAESRPVSDADGTRRIVSFFPSGTEAIAQIDGQSVPLTSGTLRMTEYTVGDSGPQAMPAELPETSLYTFAADLSFDEVGATNRVMFNQTTYFYLDNFLDSPTGVVVPNGYYDYELQRWVAEQDGVVMKVVGKTPEGFALVDATYDDPEDDLPESVEDLAILGMTDEERRVIAERYDVGDSFWRMPIEHLSPYDWNHTGVRREPPPPSPPPKDDQVEPRDGDCADGSILYCQSMQLAESISIAGTPYSIRYNSERATPNVTAQRTFVAELPSEIPDSVVSMRFYASILGRTLIDEEIPLDTTRRTVEWDGLDVYGRPWLGSATLRYGVSYVYEAKYSAAILGTISVADARESFGNTICTLGTPCCSSGRGARVGIIPIAARSNTEVSVPWERTVRLGAAGANQFGRGGWSFSHYQRYDPSTGVVLRGDGTSSPLNTGQPELVAGQRSDGDIANDGISIEDITRPAEIAVGPDGSMFVHNVVDDSIWRLREGRVPELVSDAVSTLTDMTVDAEGAVLWSVNGAGILRAVESLGGQWTTEPLWPRGFNAWEDGEPLADTAVNPFSLAFRSDGRLFFTVRRGNGYVYDLVEYLPDGRGEIVGIPVGRLISAGPDNSLVSYTADGDVVQIMPDFTTTVLMRTIGQETVGEEWESTETHGPGIDPLKVQSSQIFYDITSTPDGDVFLGFGNDYVTSAIFQIAPEGQIRALSFKALPTSVHYSNRWQDRAFVKRLAAGPDGRVYVTDYLLHRIFAVDGGRSRIGPDGTLSVASSNGGEILHFSPEGLHEYTSDATTGAELFRFGHDDAGKLISITDRSGQTTNINRPDDSTIEIVAPAGPDQSGGPGERVTTVFRTDSEGYLAQIDDPRGGHWLFEYTEPNTQGKGAGLLAQMWDPRANAQGLRAGEPYIFEYEQFTPDGATLADPDARWIVKSDRDSRGTEAGTQSFSVANTRSITAITGTWCDGRSYTRGYAVKNTVSTVTRTTGAGRAVLYRSEQPDGSPWEDRRNGKRSSSITATRTEPNGWFVTRTDPDDDRQGSAQWPGGSADYTLTDHVRLGSDVLVPTSTSLTLDPTSGPVPRSGLGHTVQQTWTTEVEDSTGGLPLPKVETVSTTFTPSTGTPRTSSTTYDAASRTMTSTSPAGRTSAYVLDDKFRILRVELPGQVPTTYLYDADGFVDHVSRVKGTKTRVTTFGYDPRGYVSSVENKVSDTVTDQVNMVNDAFGFTTQMTVPGLLTVGSTPDIAGALLTLTPDGKPTHQLSYTPLGQLAQYASPAGALSTDGTCPSGTQCWRYSLDRELEDITLPDGTIVDYAYDPVKATLTSVDVPGHGVTTFGYDSVGRRDSASAPSGGTMSFSWQSKLPIQTTWQGTHTVTEGAATVWSGTLDGTVERFYNDFFEVSELHVPGGASVRLLRDKDGLVTDIVDVGGVLPTLTLSRSPIDGHIDGTTLDTVTTTHVLDVSEVTPGFGDLLSVTADAGATDLYDATYTYDDRGRIATWTHSVEGEAALTRKLGYDGAGRLVTVHDITGGEPGTLLEEYAYDGNGNRQKAVSTYPGAVPLSAEFGTNLGCPDPTGTAANDQDQLCQYGGYDYVYNARGQLQSKSDGTVTTDYTYDGLGRLKRVTEPGMDIHYVHDALGRRVGKIRDGNLEKGWLYADALNPIAQLDSSGNVEATFIYGARAHVPDAMVMTDGTVYRLITDHLGSVRLVVNAATGVVAQRMDYDAFGRVLNDINPGFQPFGFAGGLYDDDTGLVRFGARDYDAYNGRWTAKDLFFFIDGANLYGYVHQDPVNLIDMAGKDAINVHYDGYPVATGYGFRLPLGHAGVVSVDPATGSTRYYEYGRYDSNVGQVKRRRVPDLVIGPDGRPTDASMTGLLDHLSEKWGKGRPIDDEYYSDADHNKVNDYAERLMRDKSRDPYSIFFNNCKDFANDTIQQAR